MDFNVNLNVKLDATPALVGAVSTLAGVVRPAEVLQPTIVPSGIAMGPDVQTPVTPAPSVPEQQTTSVSSDAPQEQSAQSKKPDEISDEMLRKFVGPKSKEKGKEAIFAILDEFGVNRVPDLTQEQRQAFIDKVNAL